MAKAKKPTVASGAKLVEVLTTVNRALNAISVKNRNFVWGIDISLTNPAVTIYNIKKDRFKSFSNKFKGERYDRMLAIEETFEELFAKYPPKLVVLEGFAFGKSMYRELIGEVTYAVKRCMFHRQDIHFNTPCLILPPTSLKKFISGRGNKIGKEQIVSIVREDWGAKVANHDEADSYGLCVAGVSIVAMSEFEFPFKNRHEKNLALFRKFALKRLGDMSQYEVLENFILNDGPNIERFFYSK